MMSAIRFILVCLVLSSTAVAGFYDLPDLESLDKKVKADFEKRGLLRGKTQIVFGTDMLGFADEQFTDTYRDIANLALLYKLTGKDELFSELRQRLNAVCSYEKWGDIEKRESDLNRAIPSILMSLVFSWMKEDLPRTEKMAIVKRMERTLESYWSEFQSPSDKSWVKYLNHPEYPMHLLAMYGLSYSIVESSPTMASEVMHYTRRAFEKYLRIMSDSEDGSLPQGALKGAMIDFALTLFVQNERNEERERTADLSWIKSRLTFINTPSCLVKESF